MTTIAEIESKIEDLKEQIKSLQYDIASFEYESSEDDFDSYLDEIYPDIDVCGYAYSPSYVLKTTDETAYRVEKADYDSNYDLDQCQEYNNLVGEKEDLEIELEELEEKLEELEGEIDD